MNKSIFDLNFVPYFFSNLEIIICFQDNHYETYEDVHINFDKDEEMLHLISIYNSNDETIIPIEKIQDMTITIKE